MTTAPIYRVPRQLLALHPKSRRLFSAFISSRHHVIGQRSRALHNPRSRHHRRSISATSLTLHSDKTSTNAAAAAATDATVAEGEVEITATLAANVIKPKPLFPWRHSPHPLPRLIMPRLTSNRQELNSDRDEEENPYETDYYTKGGPLGQGWPSPMEPWFRAALQGNSMHLLGMSWFGVVMPWTRNEWIENMETAFCDAFAQGVNGMIIDTYSLEDIEVITSEQEDNNHKSNTGGNDSNHESFEVDFEHTIAPNPLTEKTNDDIRSTQNNSAKPHDEEDESYNMLEHSLRNLYQSARQHSHPTKVNIVLRTKPYSAVIESMFPIFGLSRQLVRNHPNLRHSYRNLAQDMQRKHREAMAAGRRLNPVEIGKLTMNGLDELMKRSAQLSNDGMGVVTIIAQVSINCREIFCVMDVESGEILQGEGDGQPRDVTHLVRFEIVVKEPPESDDGGSWDMEIGRWQITDWDDLLDGNVWFV